MTRCKTFVAIAVFLMFTLAVPLAAIPFVNAHDPPWKIPTYAYIVAAPDPIGVGQTVHIYMWLDTVFGAAGGTTAAIGTNGSTTSSALLSNDYRFHNYQLVIRDPDGTATTQTFDVISDTTSSQFTRFTPTKVGVYNLTFTFPGQDFNAFSHYERSILVNDTYLPSTASTTLTVQEEPIPNPITSYPLPQEYWAHPIYGENTDWWAISSDWLGSGSPPPAGYTSSTLYHGDAVGPKTSHVMWTRPLQFGGVVSGNPFVEGGSNPSGAVPGSMYFEGSSYAPRFNNPIIINGILFYTEVASFTGSDIFGSVATGPTVALDLRTGKQLWSSTTMPRLSFGYIYNVWNPDQHGTYPPILVASSGGSFFGPPVPQTWQLFDAYTGLSMFNATNIPAGTSVAGPSGEQIRYVFNNAGNATNPQWYLGQWNSSKIWQYDINPYTGGGSLSPSIINASNGMLVQVIPIPINGETGVLPGGANVPVPYGSTLLVDANIPINATTTGGGIGTAGEGLTTYDWNVSLSWLDTLPVQPNYNVNTGQIVPAFPGTNPVSVVAANFGDVMLCRNGGLPTGYATTTTGYPQLPYTMLAVNLNASKGAIGQVLWSKTYDPPPGNITLQQSGVDFQTRVFTLSYRETMQWVGYSLNNGEKLWGPTPSQATFDYYGSPGVSTLTGTLAYGKLYSSSFAGICYCYDVLTGDLLWTYGNDGTGNSTLAGLATPYGDYPTFVQAIADGVVYLATDEHTIPNPLYKGSMATAINATTGEEIWRLSDYPSEWSSSGSSFVVADGYLTCMNGYDNNVYSVGRGPSATTVSAPDVAAVFGAPVVIKGTVIDVSAGTQQAEQIARFPHGVPAISDESMTDWMGYVYQQKPLPINAVGVKVTLTVVDSNNNRYDIGTATTDVNGFFHYTWTPEIPGDFSVYASFVGTNGYWPSHAVTAFSVMEEPSPTNPPTPAPASIADQYFLPVSVGLFAAIAIVGVVLALLLRRR